MSQDLLEERLAALGDTTFADERPAHDLADRVLRRYRRRQRLRVLSAGLGVAVVAIGTPVVLHLGDTGTAPHSVRVVEHSPQPVPPVSGAPLDYGTGTTIQFERDGRIVWTSRRLPAIDGRPGKGSFLGYVTPASAAKEVLLGRVETVMSPTASWVRVVFVVRNLDGVAVFHVQQAAYGLAQGQGVITGRFLAVGGVFDARPTPQRGHVYVRINGKLAVIASVAQDGRYRITLPAGTYTLTGRSPQFEASSGSVMTEGLCTARHLVTVSAQHLSSANVYCMRL